jgi:outer membrane protein
MLKQYFMKQILAVLTLRSSNHPMKLFILMLMTIPFQGNAQVSSKMGYANPEYIFSQLPDGKQIEATLKTISDQLNNVINAKDEEWKKKFADYMANEKTMLEAVRNNTLSEIEQLQENVKKLKQDGQAELEKKQQQLLQPVYMKIKKAIEDVARENGYTIVLNQRVSGVATLLFMTENNNLSDQALKKLGITPQTPTEKPVR